MPSPTRTEAAALKGAFADALPARRRRFSDEHLLWAAFHRITDTWAQSYGRHVRDWQRAISEETHTRYHTDRRFAAAYDIARTAASERLNEWTRSLRWGREAADDLKARMKEA